MDVYWNIYCLGILKLYSTPVRNKEMRNLQILKKNFTGVGCVVSNFNIFFVLLVNYHTDRRNHGLLEVFLELISLFGQLRNCQCEF